MPLKLKDAAKLAQIVTRIQAGEFDENDIDNMLIKLRPFGGDKGVFLEIAHFVAHSDVRNKGIAQETITAFADSIRYFQDYVSEKKPLDLSIPFPAYVYRLFLSQARLSDEDRLRAEHKMSHASLLKKIEANFQVDKKTHTCSLRVNKGGVGLLAALQFVTSFIHSRPSFHIRDFHSELKAVLRSQDITFDEPSWDAQVDRISLAVLCLVSNTGFTLADGGVGSCKVETENHFRLLSGQRLLPSRELTSEPTTFGNFLIMGQATVNSAAKPQLRVAFPLITTDLKPQLHCDPGLFMRNQAPANFGLCEVEIINLAPDMSMSAEFKLIRTDSLRH